MSCRKRFSQISRQLIVVGAIVGFADTALALPGDSEQPIHIKALSAKISERDGTAVYTGDVELDQGSLHVTADQLTIHTKDGDVLYITAEGELAHFRQQPEVDAALVQAHARTITYYTADQKVVLEGAAELKQADDSFRGERIEYSIIDKVVNAGGDEASRVEMVVYPRNSNDD
ncbi:MAG: lipopolysaccharide transport periplasmic protein LptA [Gammaproteobacteria bacterium]